MTWRQPMQEEDRLSASPSPRRASWMVLVSLERFWDAWIAVALMGFVWTLLRLWSYPSAFPDDSLRHLVEQTGAWPCLSPQAPLWSGLGRWVASLDAEAMHGRMQLAGHVALVVSAGLLYRIVVQFVSMALDLDAAPRWSSVVARLVGVGSALYLVCSPPVWRAAQSPHPAIFGIFLAVAAMERFLQYARWKTLSAFLLWAAIAGVGVVESPLLILLMPAWVVILLLLSYQRLDDDDEQAEDLEDAVASSWWRWLAGVAVLAAVSAACVAYVVESFDGTEGYVLRGFTRRLHVLLFFVRDYFAELLGAMPSIGWLVVVVGLLTPWVLTLLLARRVQNGDFGPRLVVLYGVAGMASVAQVAGFESVQIWSLLPSATFRLGACLMSAMTFGLVAAAWLLAAERSFRGLARSQQADLSPAHLGVQFKSILVGVVCLALGGGMLISAGMAVSPRREVAERAALRLLRDYVSAVVEDAAGCTWVVTDGVLDHALRFEAWRTGSRLQPVCILSSQPDWILRTVERRLPDPESRTLFSIGPQVMFREWLASRPEQTREVAAQLGYDLWQGTSVNLSPRRTVFRPVPVGAAAADASTLMEGHRDFWSAFETGLATMPRLDDPTLAFHLRAVRNNIARVANEVGVMAQDEAQDALSLEAYSAARRLDPQNLSSRLNLWSLSHRLDKDSRPDLGGIQEEIGSLASRFGKSSLLGVVRLHGTIRTPQALAALAAGQLQGGGRHEAMARIAAALRLLPESSRAAPALNATAAGLQWLSGDAKGARESYIAVLLKTPTDVKALLGLAAFEAAESGLDAALPLIDKARKAGAAPLLCDQLHATLCLEAEAPEAARAVLLPHVEKQSRNAGVWYLWGWAALSLDDLQGYEQAQTALRRLPNARGSSASLAVKAAMRTGDLVEALGYAKDALKENPGDPRLLETALRLCIALGDYAAAEPHAKSILAVDTGHALARYALGTQLLLGGDAAAAEPLLARSAATAPRAESLNNLACAQLRLNKLDEAAAAAKAAVELAPERVEVWDTVAEVALARGLPEEAEAAARRALQLTPHAPAAWLRVAEALAVGGKIAETRACLDRSELRSAETLAPDLSRRLESLRESL